MQQFSTVAVSSFYKKYLFISLGVLSSTGKYQKSLKEILHKYRYVTDKFLYLKKYLEIFHKLSLHLFLHYKYSSRGKLLQYFFNYKYLYFRKKFPACRSVQVCFAIVRDNYSECITANVCVEKRNLHFFKSRLCSNSPLVYPLKTKQQVGRSHITAFRAFFPSNTDKT